MAMLTPGARSETGSGMVIGVAIMFPMLMLMIVALQMYIDTARTEQALQSAANRAARTAAICCARTGGPGGAEEVVRAGLASAESGLLYNRVECNNNIDADSDTIFIDVDDQHVPNTADSDGEYGIVPTGGRAYVFVTCRMPPRILGGFALLGFEPERTAVGVATIDPFRHRLGG